MTPYAFRTSTDGLAWTQQGVGDFVGERADAVSVIGRGDAIVATVEIYLESGGSSSDTWISTDRVTWTLGTDRDYFGAVTETSQGYLITGTEWLLFTDGGDSWIAVPDHPDDPDSSSSGFSFGGIAGDLMYRSAGDGLWIGYIDWLAPPISGNMSDPPRRSVPLILPAGSRGHCNASASFSDGVIHPRVCRGRPLRECAAASRSAWVWTERSVPFGKYWRRSPFVFSFDPRCLEDCQQYPYVHPRIH